MSCKLRLGFEQLERRDLLSALVMSDGEQLVVEMINRARANPLAEADRLFLDLNEGLAPGTISAAPKQPLAPHQALINAASAHSSDMIRRNFFDHVNPDGANPAARMRQAGYDYRRWGENIAEAYDAGHFHDVLFTSPPHRTNIMDDSFREIGVGLRLGDFFWTGTENFGSRRGSAFLTGVAYTDNLLGDAFYTEGEGFDAVSVVAHRQGSGERYETVTGPSGGYTLQVPPGTYNLVAQGGELGAPISVSNVAIADRNQKVDFVIPFDPPPKDRFEPNDSLEDPAIIGPGDADLQNLTIHDPETSDYYQWTSALAGPLKVQLTTTGDRFDILVYLFDHLGNFVSTTSPPGDLLTLQADVQANETYYVYVSAYRNVNRDYRLVIDGPGPEADLLESNDTLVAATNLGNGDHQMDGLTLHLPGDVDFFRWTALAGGPLDVALEYSQTESPLNAKVYDASGSLLVDRTGQSGLLELSHTVTAGEAYYVAIQAVGDNGYSSGYRLSVDGLTPPVGLEDTAVVGPGESVVIDVTANDVDPDGTVKPETVLIETQPEHGSVEVDANGRITYRADADYLGPVVFSYTVADDEGTRSQPIRVAAAVIDDTLDAPWQNPIEALDVNYDGRVAPIDVLLIINDLNERGARTLPLPGGTVVPLPYIDVSGSGSVEPLDALLVINLLNNGAGEGESDMPTPQLPERPTGWLPVEDGFRSRPERMDESPLAPTLHGGNSVPVRESVIAAWPTTVVWLRHPVSRSVPPSTDSSPLLEAMDEIWNDA